MRSCSVRTFEPPYPPTRRRESTRAFPSPSVSMETAHQGRVNSKGYKEVYKKRPKNRSLIPKEKNGPQNGPQIGPQNGPEIVPEHTKKSTFSVLSSPSQF